jgi:starvation-inducible DNA-binding protein
MADGVIDVDVILNRAKPLAHHQAPEIQPYGHLVRLPLALAQSACKESVENLKQVLADTIALRDLYKKHHWQAAGPTFCQLHRLFDKHYAEQNDLVDKIAERIQLLAA